MRIVDETPAERVRIGERQSANAYQVGRRAARISASAAPAWNSGIAESSSRPAVSVSPPELSVGGDELKQAVVREGRDLVDRSLR